MFIDFLLNLFKSFKPFQSFPHIELLTLTVEWSY